MVCCRSWVWPRWHRHWWCGGWRQRGRAWRGSWSRSREKWIADYLGVSVFVFFSADYWNLQNYFLSFNSNIALSQTQKIIIRWRRWNFVAMVEVEGKKVALGYRIIWASFIFPRYFILKRFSLLWKKMSIILWFLIFLGKCFLKTKDIKKIYEEYKINSYIKKHIRKTTIQAWCWHVILLVFFKWRIT